MTTIQNEPVRICRKPATPRSHTPLYGDYKVDTALLNSVKQQVENAIPTMKQNAAYTLESLSSKEYWKVLDSGERRMAGRCMAHLVAKNLLPMCFAESKHEYPKHYKLK
jgi:hypothetical protein